MSSSNNSYPYMGVVVESPHYDLAEVSFVHHGAERRVPIDKPDGYYPQHALIGRQVSFTLVQCPTFPSELGFASINPELWQRQSR